MLENQTNINLLDFQLPTITQGIFRKSNSSLVISSFIHLQLKSISLSSSSLQCSQFFYPSSKSFVLSMELLHITGWWPTTTFNVVEQFHSCSCLHLELSLNCSSFLTSKECRQLLKSKSLSASASSPSFAQVCT